MLGVLQRRLCEECVHTHHRECRAAAAAPGRVNLIGEHIDYSGYAVLPIALDRGTAMAGCLEQDSPPHTLSLHSAHTSKKNFQPGCFVVESAAGLAHLLRDQEHSWHKYILAGLKAIMEELELHPFQHASLSVFVDGNLPVAAGLSSSASLICASMLLFLQLSKKSIAPERIAELAANAERFIGVEVGGMDQAICILAQEGHACRIEFNPLTANPVPLPNPEDFVFVVANSLVTAEKYVSADACYNCRVAEVRLASLVLAHKLGVLPTLPATPLTLSVVQNGCGLSMKDMLDQVQKFLPLDPIDLTWVAEETSLSKDEISSWLLCKSDGSPLCPPSVQHFFIRARAQHVYEEAMRVNRFSDLCAEAFGKEPSRVDKNSTAVALGALMNESHASCRELFACSCPELDTLTQIARENGALGSRLTGAGWGGCTVSLVPAELVDSFIETVGNLYYQEFLGLSWSKEELSECIFASGASRGASALLVSPGST